MNQKFEIIKSATEYWTNLVSKEIEKFKHENQIDLMPNFIQKKYNFAVKLDDFKDFLFEYIVLNYPKLPRQPMIQLSCIGEPVGVLRTLMQKAQLEPSLLSGKIIEMEIDHKYAKVWNRKENTSLDLAPKKLSSKKNDRVL